MRSGKLAHRMLQNVCRSRADQLDEQNDMLKGTSSVLIRFHPYSDLMHQVERCS
jgi:hypothetical protein